MKWLIRLSSIIIALCLFIILFINAVDYAVYYRPDFYKTTYSKYHVTEYANMEMEEVLKVSNHLINYLKSKDTLEDVQAVVNGKTQKFFSQRELLHMKDVKVLFDYGITLRYICIAIIILLLSIMLIGKFNFLQTLTRCILGTFLSLLSLLGILALVISTNFNKAFITFHKLFFDNDLWLLDPDEDWMIRLLPEGFFKDMAIVIFIVFLISLFIILAICLIWLKLYYKKHKK